MAEQVPQIAVDPVPEEQIMKVQEQQQKIYSHNEPKAIDPSGKSAVCIVMHSGVQSMSRLSWAL